MNYTLFACGPTAEMFLIIYGVFALWVVEAWFCGRAGAGAAAGRR